VFEAQLHFVSAMLLYHWTNWSDYI